MRTLSPSTSAKLFATGFTVGPIVDSFHNQCLLKYDILPISLSWPTSTDIGEPSSFFCSSWTVPPLLGIAYVVLGGILPRIFEALLSLNRRQSKTTIPTTLDYATDGQSSIRSTTQQQQQLQQKAFLAVATTALIIKLSEFLETNPSVTDAIFGGSSAVAQQDAHLLVMLAAALSQWAVLDGTLPALIAASITSIGGPLSELPFVANGVWEYLDAASDYFPLANIDNGVLQLLLGDGYQNLALSSITGPCYFAVTMDAIALGRWFDNQDSDQLS